MILRAYCASLKGSGVELEDTVRAVITPHLREWPGPWESTENPYSPERIQAMPVLVNDNAGLDTWYQTGVHLNSRYSAMPKSP